MMGLLIIPLIAMTAFAVDLGAWYAQGTRMQRAADNAALAGVVWMPDKTAAHDAADKVLKANGFGGTFTYSFPTEQQMEVSINRPASMYFSRLFVDSETLARGATAEFNKPVPLGSPANTAGNQPENCPQFQPTQTSPCGPQPMLWQAIQGPYEAHENGDAFATLCKTGASGSGCGTPAAPSNPDYAPEGYEYAIDVPASAIGTPITVSVWDAAQTQRTLGNTAAKDCNSSAAPWGSGFPSGFNYQNCQTGDSGPTDRNGLNMQYQIWDNDQSDLTTSFTTPLPGCELYIPRDTSANPTTVSTYKNKWVDICTFTPTAAGVYPMRVKSSNITHAGSLVADSTSATGWNGYALRATGASDVNLYSLSKLSIWTNTPGSTARFYLAEIKPEHKGKKIELDLFDPGDVSGPTPATMQVIAPPGSSPFNVSPSVVVPPQYGQVVPAANVVDSCKANMTGTSNRPTSATPLSNATNCKVTTYTGSTQKYQNLWLRFEIQLSPNYNCTTDCWWTIKYDFGSGSVPHDRTSWVLNVVGDPVHLVH